MERLNQTLKEMLRKTVKEEDKDWDKLIPFVLLAYREVPQESTGFSPFKLLYGREVQRPLDILKEEWEASPRSDKSVVSHILLIGRRWRKWRTRSDRKSSRNTGMTRLQGRECWLVSKCYSPHHLQVDGPVAKTLQAESGGEGQLPDRHAGQEKKVSYISCVHVMEIAHHTEYRLLVTRSIEGGGVRKCPNLERW